MDAGCSDEPITPDEVATWFPKTKYGRPSATRCETFASRLELYRMFYAARRQGGVEASSTSLQFALSGSRDLLPELRSVVLENPGGIVAKRAAAIVAAIDEFLALAPKPKLGPPQAEWGWEAVEWSKTAQQILDDHRRETRPSRGAAAPAPSRESKDGPVVAVVTEALHRVFGIEVDRHQVASVLSRRLAAIATTKRRDGSSPQSSLLSEDDTASA